MTNTTHAQQEFIWPCPPHARYKSQGPIHQPIGCELEGINGISRTCLLTRIDVENKTAYIVVPPSKNAIPVKFGLFRRITLHTVLHPLPISQDDDLSVRLAQLPLVDFHVNFKSGDELSGQTISHVKQDWGLFLFPPTPEHGAVHLVLIPSEAIADYKIETASGFSRNNIPSAMSLQGGAAQPKLGDLLSIEEITTPEELLTAIEQQANMPVMRLGEALMAMDMLTEDQLNQALILQKQNRSVPLGELLVQTGVLTQLDLSMALARKMGFPLVDVALFPAQEQAVKKLPYGMAKRLNVLPLLLTDEFLVVAADDPTQRRSFEEIEFAIQIKVKPVLAGEAEIKAALDTVYERFNLVTLISGHHDASANLSVADTGKLLQTLEDEVAEVVETEKEIPIEHSDNSLVKLINTMILDAHQRGVSDIHIETHPGTRKVKIRFRKDGVMAPYIELPHTYRAALVSRIKIMSELDISERRKPQDGKINFSRFVNNLKLELRVATIPTNNSLEDVVMRLLASSKPIALDQLGLTPDNLKRLKEAVSRPHGMVLCVGPTGSGKTTTLHSVLGYLNTPDKKIWTAEDPVEITQPDLRQVQVNPKIDWTFAKALRAFLRADPDIIMVGEIRDTETAGMAVEASLTGHLVLSTLHTNSAAETVTRLLDMGLDPFNFADSLLAVLAQRLIRRLCKSCKTSHPMEDALIEEILTDYLRIYPVEIQPDRLALKQAWIGRYGQNGQLMRYTCAGCADCEKSGLKGRVGLHELLSVTANLRRLIQTSSPPAKIQAAALEEGVLHTLRQDGLEKVLAGLSSLEEVRANT